jgi:hypothetical protein
MSDEAKKIAPPYAPFSTLLNVFNKLRETTVPSRIDPSVFGNMSGGASYSIIAALKFLKLIREDGTPVSQLAELVNAEDQARKPIIRKILRDRYPTLFDGQIDLRTVSAGQFDDHIREAFDVKGSTVDKVAAFFIAAATFADEPISPHLKARKPIAPSSTSRKSSKQRKNDAEGETLPPHDPPPPPESQSKPLEYQLIDLMSEPDIEDEVRQSIWALVQYLTKRKAKTTDDDT